MEIYKSKIYIDTPTNYFKHYYGNLGSFTNLLGSDFYENIIAISPLIKGDHNSFFYLTIKGEKHFKLLADCILQENVFININGQKVPVQSIDYAFNSYKPDNKYELLKSIEIHFLSPTLVKKEMHGIDINQMLPVPEIFLTSCIRKYIKVYGISIDIDLVKKEIQKKIIVGSFNIRSERVKIKNNYKAGVIGEVKYTLIENLDQEVHHILYESLRFCDVAGMGSGTKLGLGQTKIFFHKK